MCRRRRRWLSSIVGNHLLQTLIQSDHITDGKKHKTVNDVVLIFQRKSTSQHREKSSRCLSFFQTNYLLRFSNFQTS